METRQRRRPPAGRRPANKKPVPARRRREAPEKKKRPAPARRRTERQNRTVRPPRQDVPEVVYTIPRPLTKGRILIRFGCVIAVVAAVMMVMSFVFRVDTVTVLGAEKYTAWAIREASGITDGEALLSLSKARAAGKIKAALPYVDEVKIEVKLPGTVHIEVKERDVVYSIAAGDDRWWLISADGIALEAAESSEAADHLQIFGLRIAAPTPGQLVTAAAPVEEPLPPEVTETPEQTEATEETQAPEETVPEETEATEPTEPTEPTETQPPQVPDSDAQRLSAVLEILQSMEHNGIIGKVGSINVENLLDIRMTYDQRLNIRLGNSTQLGYKISYLAQAVRQMEAYQTGVFDLTFEQGDYGILDPEQ